MKRHTRNLIRVIKQNIGNPSDVIRGVEVGVWEGDNSAQLLKHLPTIQLSCVDPWHLGGEHDSMPKSARELREGMKKFLEVTSFAKDRCITFPMTSVKAAGQFQDASIDFVFLDANHSYSSVFQDVRLWHPKIRPGGLLCGHDYNGQGDRRGGFGVKPAVDEFVTMLKKELHVEGGLVWWFKV
ncbi:class I SAM-dependent methyltransferase [Candidatus Pacearchaeota archaeon]|jgi:hypothetical protein|nr:class I SAM-dependent methyltransferase [Candidatus Pacearchaeota archaeon]